MPGMVLYALHTYLILTSPLFILTFQMMKLNHREAKQLAQDYIANKQESRDLKLLMAKQKAFFSQRCCGSST